MATALKIDWRQGLAWRMKRHMLAPPGDASAVDVVARICGVQAQVASAAELAIRLRQAAPERDEVGRALESGALIKTWAMRGTLHLLAARDAGDYLSLMAAGRTWERPSWVRYFGVAPKDWERIRPAVAEALDGRALTRDELIVELTARTGFDHLAEALRSGWGTLLKPLAWQGDLCFGPSRGGNVTFSRPGSISREWSGVPPVDEAAPRVIEAYLAAYGPATDREFAAWTARGWLSKRRTDRWFARLQPSLAEVEVDGERAFVLAEHVDELAATRPIDTVRLLGGFDQWVLGPGTDDGHVTPAARRSAVSKQSGWIAPVVIVGGVVAGTWEIKGSRLAISWFPESGPLPDDALDTEVERLGSILGQPLTVTISS